MNEPIRFCRIFSKEEFFRILENGRVVAARHQILIPESENLGIAVQIVGKVAEARFGGGGMFGMVFDHPQYVRSQSQTVHGGFAVGGVIADEDQAVLNLIRYFAQALLKLDRFRFR